MWFIFSLAAAVLWGLTYVLNEQILKHISVPSSIAIFCFFTSFIMIGYSFLNHTLEIDIYKIIHSQKLTFLIISSIISFALAEIMIGSAIQGKNATLASLIEISYPFFTVLFSYLLFKEIRMSLSIFVGGGLILTGAFLIFYFKQ